MKKPFPCLCQDCRWSRPEDGDRGRWNNRCFNPVVVSRTPWALAQNHEGQPCGAECYGERSKTSPFAACGMRGRRWASRKGGSDV